jgi:two-component system OmpR family sensor kinase
MLSSIFERLSTLLGELVEVERIASGSEPFGERTRIRLGEIVNEACRRLYCEGEIPIEIPQNRTLTADREAMVIVAKNLLDNARKYGADPRVYLEGDRLVFSSEGPRLEHPLEHYTEPFRQEYGTERSPGFGLGLYIVKEILERHGMELHYRHEEGRNLFTVGPVTGL